MAELIDNNAEQVQGDIDSRTLRAGKDQVETTCEPCKIDNTIQPAVGWCETCNELLCNDCYKIHCRPTMMRHHQLRSLVEIGNQMDKKKVTNRCRNSGGHENCTEGASISEVTSRTCEESKALELLLSKLEKRLRTIEEKAEKHSSITQRQHDEAIADIHAAGERLKTLIDKIVIVQIEQADEAKANNIKCIQEVKETNEYISHKISTVKETLGVEDRESSHSFINMKHLQREVTMLESMLDESEEIHNIKEYEFVVNPELAQHLEAFTELGVLENKQDRNMARATDEVVDELEVRRLQSSTIPWDYNSGQPDAIQMSTDRDVRLLYVLLYPCRNGDTNVQLSITEGTKMLRCNATHANKGEDVMAVKVVSENGAHGIRLQAGHRYKIAATIMGGSSYSGKSGESDITVEGVKFSFSNTKSSNGTTVSQGQIPGFRFSLL